MNYLTWAVSGGLSAIPDPLSYIAIAMPNFAPGRARATAGRPYKSSRLADDEKDPYIAY